MTILPHTGIDDLRLGLLDKEAISLLSEPDDREHFNFTDDTFSEVWEYSELGIELSFDSDYSGRLSSIRVIAPSAQLDGQKIIGVTLDELSVRFPSFVFDQDFEENGSCYEDSSRGLSIWITDGIVSSITLFPDWIDDDTPKWPE